MRIAVMATGAVGGYFGGRLAAAGAEVHFIARGAHLAALRTEGLRLESPVGDLQLRPVHATDDPATIGPVDAVLFAVKLWDTEAAAAESRPLVGPDTIVVPLQNGVESVERIGAVLDRATVLGGVAYISAHIAGPGTIRHAAPIARMVFGTVDGRSDPRADALLAACRQAGFDATLSPDIVLELWQKFVFLVGLSGLTALTRQPIGPVRADPDTRRLLAEAMAEVVAVGRARGVALDPAYVEDRLALCDRAPADMKASMLVDLERGNRLELDWLAGAVVRMGQALGVPTPANRFIHAALKLHAGGAR